MKYLNEERFIVNSNDREGRKNYNENYDRIFGEKPEPPASVTVEVSHPDPNDPDALLVTVRREEPPDCSGECPGCDEEHCECDEHDPECGKLCTRGAVCDCGRYTRI